MGGMKLLIQVGLIIKEDNQMNEKIQKCHTCYYDNKCYWQELADHIPMDCNDYKKEDKQ